MQNNYNFYTKLASIPLYAYYFQVFIYIITDPNAEFIKDAIKDEEGVNVKKEISKKIRNSGGFYQFLVRTHNELGKVFKFQLGDQTFVSVKEPDMLQYSLKDQFDKSNNIFMESLRPFLGSSSVIFENGKTAQFRRKKIFSPQNFLKAKIFHSNYRLKYQ
ncbi:Cytochrome P450 [Pseudocohnilembus persalinus]|uniref:Cytochrome P450 n=1 Tax=Pseudocohnilembus persalinus TaxID=266149 RepID=A0A0V0R057_PSEPJ|nr:Cytochrome P450 [Pseudocohnilembus persalinus]|eukprot:KRX07835.1 Cytochrome P450 [Pseudocohnilembus persalinus]